MCGVGFCLYFSSARCRASGISRERSPGQGLGDLPAEWQEHRDDPGPGGWVAGWGGVAIVSLDSVAGSFGDITAKASVAIVRCLI